MVLSIACCGGRGRILRGLERSLCPVARAVSTVCTVCTTTKSLNGASLGEEAAMREQYTGTHVSHCVWPPHDDVRAVNGGGRATYDSVISAGDSGVGGVCGSVLGSVAHDMARVTSRAVLVASTSNVATPFTPVLHCTRVKSKFWSSQAVCKPSPV